VDEARDTWHSWGRKENRILTGKPAGKIPLGRRRSKMGGLEGMCWDGVDWIDLAQGSDKWRDS